MVQFEKNRKYFGNSELTADKVEKEVEAGLELLEGVEHKIVSVFGSHSIGDDEEFSIHAKELAKTLGKKGYALCSGGGPGIMKAVNSGATEAGVPSIGLKEALLQGEQGVGDELFTHQYGFEFMFVRRFVLAIKSHALVFYPGGFGTLNELFEYVVLMQTNILDKVPMICVGREFWEGMFSWVEEKMVSQGFVKKEHLDLITVVDTVEEVIEKIK